MTRTATSPGILHSHIGTIEKILGGAPEVDMSTNYFEGRAALDTWRKDLRRQVAEVLPDAKISESWDGATFRLDNFKASSTSSVEGALRNWCTAARKRIERAVA